MDPKQSVSDEADSDRTSEGDRARLWDVGYEAAGDDEYECLDCGVVVTAEEHPLTCPTCESALRNRSMPIE